MMDVAASSYLLSGIPGFLGGVQLPPWTGQDASMLRGAVIYITPHLFFLSSPSYLCVFTFACAYVCMWRSEVIL